MATYSTDFSEYTTGQAPADWTERWHSDVAALSVLEAEGSLGGKHLKLTASAQNRYRATWDDLDSDEDRADFEILAKGRIDESTGQLWVSGRISGGTTSETGYSLIVDDNVNEINLHRYDNASSTNLTAVSFAPSVGTWYWIRFQCIGTALKGKVWVDGDDEPETWTTETTDSALADAGAIGIGAFRQFGQSWDFFSVGTGGDPAPGPGGGDRALTADPGSVTITGGDAGLRAGRRIGADAGAVTLAAQDAALRRDAGLSAEAGSVALAVQDAGLRAARRLTAGGGSVALTGGAAGLRAGRAIQAEGAAVTLTAHDATLSTSSDKTLTAEAGAIALTAGDAGLRRAARLVAQPGAVAIAPKVADLLRHGRLPAEPGSLAIGAAAARLLRHRAIRAEPAAVAIAAQPVTFRATRRLLAEGTALALIGRPADLRILGRAEFVPGVPDVWTAAPRDTVWTARARGTVWTAAPRGTVWTARKR